MQFLYHENAGDTSITLKGESFHYLYKVRRMRSGESLRLRNLRDDMLYTYHAIDFTKKSVTLQRLSAQYSPNTPAHFIHLIWAIIEPKQIEKYLPTLNELGVGKITFFYAHYSQRNIELDLGRLKRILIHSCEQSGRSAIPEIELLESFKEAHQRYSDSAMLDFDGEMLQNGVCSSVMIGPEGGWSEDERSHKMKKFSSGNLILRSESAAMFALARLM